MYRSNRMMFICSKGLPSLSSDSLGGTPNFDPINPFWCTPNDLTDFSSVYPTLANSHIDSFSRFALSHFGDRLRHCARRYTDPHPPRHGPSAYWFDMKKSDYIFLG